MLTAIVAFIAFPNPCVSYVFLLTSSLAKSSYIRYSENSEIHYYNHIHCVNCQLCKKEEKKRHNIQFNVTNLF